MKVIKWVGLYDKEIALGNDLNELNEQIEELQERAQRVFNEWLAVRRAMLNFKMREGD